MAAIHPDAHPDAHPAPTHLVRRLFALLDPAQPGVYGVSRRRRLGRHPIHGLDDLVGWTAPSCWWAAALVAPATAIGPDGVHEFGLLHLVGRDGHGISGRCIDGHVELLHDGTGPVDDLCRRALGLPTPPPGGDVTALLDLLWLDRLLGETLERPLGSPGPTPDEVRARRPSATDWAELRRACAAGRLALPGLTPGQAGWFDDGSLARWAWRLLPDPAELLGDLAQLLAPPSFEALRSGLRSGPLRRP